MAGTKLIPYKMLDGSIVKIGEQRLELVRRYYFDGEELHDIANDVGLKLESAKTAIRSKRARRVKADMLEAQKDRAHVRAVMVENKMLDCADSLMERQAGALQKLTSSIRDRFEGVAPRHLHLHSEHTETVRFVIDAGERAPQLARPEVRMVKDPKSGRWVAPEAADV